MRTLLIIVFFFSFTCCQKVPTTTPVDMTLYDKYPNWRYLTWVSTNNNSDPLTADPILNINIANTIALTEKIGKTTWLHEYRDIKVTSDTVTFLKPLYGGSVVREYAILQPPDSSKIKLSCLGNTYVLKKH